MNALWTYLWPIIAAGMVIGAIAGTVGFRSLIIRPKDPLAGDTL